MICLTEDKPKSDSVDTPFAQVVAYRAQHRGSCPDTLVLTRLCWAEYGYCLSHSRYFNLRGRVNPKCRCLITSPLLTSCHSGPGLSALLDYAREREAIVVVRIDRLRRNAAEVMTTIRELGERGVVLRSLREGIDNSNATERHVFLAVVEVRREHARFAEWDRPRVCGGCWQ